MSLEIFKVDHILNCPCCGQVYEDPRILTCGKSICNDCAQTLVQNKKSNCIKCPICRMFHRIPKHGFIQNYELAQLSKLKTCSIADEFRAHLETIQNKTKTFGNDLKMGEYEIKEFCSSIRSDVFRAWELNRKRLDEHKTELVRQINAYESECGKKFCQTKRENKIDYDSLINEAEQFYTRWSSYLKEADKSEREIADACAKAKECIKRLEAETTKLQIETFNGKVLIFEENVSSQVNTIGEIILEDLQTSDDGRGDSLDGFESPVKNRSPQYTPPRSNHMLNISKSVTRSIVINSRKFNDQDDDEDL